MICMYDIDLPYIMANTKADFTLKNKYKFITKEIQYFLSETHESPGTAPQVSCLCLEDLSTQPPPRSTPESSSPASLPNAKAYFYFQRRTVNTMIYPKIWPYSVWYSCCKQDHPEHTHHWLPVPGILRSFSLPQRRSSLRKKGKTTSDGKYEMIKTE